MANLITLPAEFIAMYERQSLMELMQEFQNLSKQSDIQEHETRKLSILKIFEERLLKKAQQPVITIPITAPKSFEQQAFIKFAYRFCMLFGFFEKAAGSFLFGSTLFALIPGINQFSLYALTVIYTLLDALLFYAFEVSFLKKHWGMGFSDNGKSLLNKTYIQQLEVLTVINIILNSRETFDWEQKEYREYCVALKHLNQYVIKKHSTMGEYASTPTRVAIEKGVIIFGALSSVADSYFMAKTALLTLHISFMSSPLGWALVVAMIVSALVFYYAMGVQSMSKLVHPDRKSFYALKDNISLFKQKYENREPYQPKNIIKLCMPPLGRSESPREIEYRSESDASCGQNC